MLYDLSPDQCGSNADCTAFGANAICQDGLCKGGSAGSGPSGECATSEDCENLHAEPTACIETTPGTASSRTCVGLQSAECPVILPQTHTSSDEEQWRENLRGENPIILGAYAFLPSSLVSNFTRNYELALMELTRKTLGVPGPGGTTRPLVMVVCKNNYANRSELDASLTHLVGDLKVPGLIATLPDDDLQYAFSDKVGADAKVFFMSPVGSDERFARLEDDNLLWHLLPGGKYVALPYAPLLTRTIDYLVSSGTVPAAEPIKAALLTNRDVPLLSEASDTIYDTIHFNGMTADENRDAATLLTSNVSSSDPLTDRIDAIMAFQPHVIISAAGAELFTTIIPAIEARWDAEVPTQPRPFYLLSPLNYNDDERANLLAATPDIYLRMAGVNAASTPDSLKQILTDYERAWDDEFPEVAGQRGRENFYDAVYYLMYGIVAGASKLNRFDGSHIAAGMGRLMSGSAFSVGRDDILDAFSTLAINRPITLNGTLGPPDFDFTGARSTPGSVWCMEPAAEMSQAPQQLVDVLRYDSGNLVGNFPCIPGF